MASAAMPWTWLVHICRQLVRDDCSAVEKKLSGCPRGEDSGGTASTCQLFQGVATSCDKQPRQQSPDEESPSKQQLYALSVKSTRARKPPASQQDLPSNKRPALPRSIPGAIPTSSHPRTTTPCGPPPLQQQQQQPANPQRVLRTRAHEQAPPPTTTPTHEEDPAPGTSTQRTASAEAAAVFTVQQLLQPLSPLEFKVQTESTRVGQALQQHASSASGFAVALGAAVSKLGCRVVLRKITDTKQYWSKSMSNTFVVCVLPGVRGKPTGLIVDPHFKEQFITAHMTDRYREIWSVLPDVFVGQVAQLMSLVQVLSQELAIMFDTLGGVLPPWRGYNAYISRWISKSCVDSVVSFVDSKWVTSGWKSSDMACCDRDKRAEQALTAAQQPAIMQPVVVTGFDVASV